MIDRPDGVLVWGTFRPTAEQARAVFEKWNPVVPGHESAARVVSVEIVLSADGEIS